MSVHPKTVQEFMGWPVCQHCEVGLVAYGEGYWRCPQCERDSESSDPPWGRKDGD